MPTMTTAVPYAAGDTVRALVRTERGTALATGTVADCSLCGESRWGVRVTACGTEHRFTVTRDGSDANGYLERIPRVVGGRRNSRTTTTDEAETS